MNSHKSLHIPIYPHISAASFQATTPDATKTAEDYAQPSGKLPPPSLLFLLVEMNSKISIGATYQFSWRRIFNFAYATPAIQSISCGPAARRFTSTIHGARRSSPHALNPLPRFTTSSLQLNRFGSNTSRNSSAQCTSVLE